MHLVAGSLSLSFALFGACFLVTTSKEVAFWAFLLRRWAVLAEMSFLLTVETFIFAACFGSIDIHGVRVFLLDLFHCSFLNENKELLRLDRVGTGVDSFDCKIALRVVL